MPGLWVFLGGGAGALTRWGLAGLLAPPWGVFACNVLGSFLLALVVHPASPLGSPTRIALGTGFLGAFTTYSTFNVSLVQALHRGAWRDFALELLATVLVALAAGSAGWACASRWFSAP